LLARDRANAEALCGFLEEEPCSEASLVRAASRHFPSNARVMLGNSLPLREWDLAAPRDAEDRIFFANRGVNGIDGLVSTTLGLAGPDRPTAALLGDLSALYDLAGLWPAAQLAGADLTIAVMNNGGGKIFDPMFGHRAFLNAHDLRLQGWAEMFGWHYAVAGGPQDPWPQGRPRLVEILPDPLATQRLADKYAALWR
jgi:2-succinyl-5-enolpyruvyl-6-hydroxy-3-cyclohexene-1-carboxylate synthase